MEKMYQPPSVQAEAAEPRYVFKVSHMQREAICQHITKVDQHFSKSSLTQLLLACKSAKLWQITADANLIHGLCPSIFLGFELSDVIPHTWASLLLCCYQTSKSSIASIVPGFSPTPQS